MKDNFGSSKEPLPRSFLLPDPALLYLQINLKIKGVLHIPIDPIIL